jgi:transcriptional regulator with XRE-family HTH domain
LEIEVNKADLLLSALGSVMQERRRQLGLSQDEVAKRAELHRTYISDLERRSRNFSVKIFLQVAQALDISPTELMIKAEAVMRREKEAALAVGEVSH